MLEAALYPNHEIHSRVLTRIAHSRQAADDQKCQPIFRTAFKLSLIRFVYHSCRPVKNPNYFLRYRKVQTILFFEIAEVRLHSQVGFLTLTVDIEPVCL